MKVKDVKRPTLRLLPRYCPSCKGEHPPLTTCPGGWNPWNGKPLLVPDLRRVRSDVTTTSRTSGPGWDYALTPEEGGYCWKLAESVREARGDSWGPETERGMSLVRRQAGGFMGEVAVARVLGFPHWLPQLAGDLRDGVPEDGPHPHGVRQVDIPAKRLILYATDSPAVRYVSVVGTPEAATFTARGWYPGEWDEAWDATAEGVYRDVWVDGRHERIPGYFVPTDLLHGMPEL